MTHEFRHLLGVEDFLQKAQCIVDESAVAYRSFAFAELKWTFVSSHRPILQSDVFCNDQGVGY